MWKILLYSIQLSSGQLINSGKNSGMLNSFCQLDKIWKLASGNDVPSGIQTQKSSANAIAQMQFA